MPSATPPPGKNLAELCPDVADEWHPDLNAQRPFEVRVSSGKKAWWQCSLGHVWDATISSRTGKVKAGCRICANQEVLSGFNDLASQYPHIAAEWDYAANNLTPDQVGPRSMKYAHWVCSVGHKWRTRVQDRLKPTNSSGCPYCSNKKLLTGFNDLATRYPEIAAEWDYSKNNGITPQDIIYGTNAYCHWKCVKGHQWRARASRRAVPQADRRNCPECVIVQGSLIESAFREAFRNSTILTDVAAEGVKYPITWRNRRFVNVDIFGRLASSGTPVAIEYDGVYYHSADGRSKGAVERDIEKTQALLNHGFIVVRIRENDLPHLLLKNDGLLQISYQYSLQPLAVSQSVAVIESWASTLK